MDAKTPRVCHEVECQGSSRRPESEIGGAERVSRNDKVQDEVGDGIGTSELVGLGCDVISP